MISCEIYAYGTSEQVSLIYTGFALLAAKKQINLTYNFNQYSRHGKTPVQFVSPDDLQGVFVVLNKNKTIFYDTTDGENMINEALDVSDIYFKRSYLETAIPTEYKAKVFPFGLNFPVYKGVFDWFEFYRLYFSRRNYKESPRELIKWVLRNVSIRYNPTVRKMHVAPKPNQEPRVLFMVRTWDPDYFPAALADENKEMWQKTCRDTNETRALVIETLRKELGDKFYGGFAKNEHAEKNYKNLLLEDNNLSKKKNYVKILHDHSICIATTGLYNSIGWKFGEYVAFSKAIVSEKLYYTVPGSFDAGKNYLEFDTAKECVKQTLNLFENDTLRRQMMENNYNYYKEYLSPDKQILRTLNISLGIN
jgi:hypothetical protein